LYGFKKVPRRAAMTAARQVALIALQQLLATMCHTADEQQLLATMRHTADESCSLPAIIFNVPLIRLKSAKDI
jgi:hypothetical protein